MKSNQEYFLLLDLDEKDFPLTDRANIICNNALIFDWNDLVEPTKVSYIMGNPPFVGMQMMSKEQKTEITDLFRENSKAGSLDYVSGWYIKALRYTKNTQIKTAFVSTNSITQGEQIGAFWKYLFDECPTLTIIFGYRTFIWNSDAKDKAAVHCVIVCFSSYQYENIKSIYYPDGSCKVCERITPYLTDGDIVFVERRTKPISDVPIIHRGNQPTDGGNLIIEESEYSSFIQREPKAAKFIKRFMMGYEFINSKPRYCLWLVNASRDELADMPLVMERVQKVRQMREESTFEQTRKMAETPTLFREQINPSTFIAIPIVSSERRAYIPIGYLNGETIPGNKLFIIEDATMYHFGVLNSSVHMDWMRAVAGRLKSDYSYSKDIVYNCFAWPTPTEEQKAIIEQTAKAILDVRANYPDKSLAVLYDPDKMPTDLKAAHEANDKAVMDAYGFSFDMAEPEIVAELMKMYQELTKNQ